MAETLTTPRKREERRTRIPMGIPSLKLALPELTGYVCRWINDQDDRLERAVNGGYEYVTRTECPQYGQAEVTPGNSDLGERVSRVVGTDRNSRPMRAFLMKIKQEWYNEDQAAKTRELDRIDQAVAKGQVNAQPGDGRYVKDGDIKLTVQ